jgi:hypothetical protein
VSVSGTARAADQTGGPVAGEERLVAGPFLVESVDRSTRTVTVRSPDGSRMTLDVSANAAGFDNLKKGDRVNLDYFRAMVVRLTPARGTSVEMIEVPSHAQPSSRSQPTAKLPRPTSDPPRGELARRLVTTSVQLTSVDPERKTIQFTTSGGSPQTLHVRDPALQERLPSLKPGDRASVTYTEPVVTSIRRSDKQ